MHELRQWLTISPILSKSAEYYGSTGVEMKLIIYNPIIWENQLINEKYISISN